MKRKDNEIEKTRKCNLTQEMRMRGNMITSSERARELGRIGGNESSETKKEVKYASKIVTEWLDAIAVDKDNKPIVDPSDGHPLTWRESLIKRVQHLALNKGNLKAIKYLFELSGEAPSVKTENRHTFDPSQEPTMPLEF